MADDGGDDGDCVRRVIAGDSRAFEPLVRRWSAPVTAVCRARVGRADVAEELAQETLVRAYRALATLNDAARFGHWACGIATRVCLDWLKDADRRQVSLDDMGPAAPRSAAPVENAHAARLDRLRIAVQALPDKHREVIMLYYSASHTYQEVAQLLGVSFATVNARLTHARAMLRERLAEEETDA